MYTIVYTYWNPALTYGRCQHDFIPLVTCAKFQGFRSTPNVSHLNSIFVTVPWFVFMFKLYRRDRWESSVFSIWHVSQQAVTTCSEALNMEAPWKLGSLWSNQNWVIFWKKSTDIQPVECGTSHSSVICNTNVRACEASDLKLANHSPSTLAATIIEKEIRGWRDGFD